MLLLLLLVCLSTMLFTSDVMCTCHTAQGAAFMRVVESWCSFLSWLLLLPQVDMLLGERYCMKLMLPGCLLVGAGVLLCTL